MNEMSPEVPPPMPEVTAPAPEAMPEPPLAPPIIETVPDQPEPQIHVMEQPQPVESEPTNNVPEQTELVDSNDPYELLDQHTEAEPVPLAMEQEEMDDPYEMPEQAHPEPQPERAESVEADLAAKSGLTPEKYEEIRDTPRGLRPEPGAYREPQQIDDHLKQFDTGHRNQSDVMKYGIGRMDNATVDYNGDPMGVGAPVAFPLEQGRAFITPYQTDEIASDTGPAPVHIEMTGLQNRHLAMPSGNESAATAEWRPTGTDTKADIPEAVVDLSQSPVNRMIRNSFEESPGKKD